MSSPFYIKAGMSPKEYNQRNAVHAKKNIDKQPAGINFYEQSWNGKQKGTVQVDHGKYSFSIPNVLSSTGTEDTELPEDGIYKFSINSGITPDEFIAHDQARIQFMKFIQDIVALGWQPYIGYFSQPRLSGRDSLLYAQKKPSYAPDPLYTPTLDEWMALRSNQSWVFHRDNIFLTVGYRRDNQFLEKDGAGVYLLTFRVMTRDAHARNYFQGDERDRWKDLWIETIKKTKIMRYKKEVELIKEGYHINTEYVEPKIHPQDPVEPDGDETRALLDYIQQHNQ